MLFNSLTFILFVMTVVPLYWSLPYRPRIWLLFLSSLLFYGFWRVEYLPIMLLSTVTDYLVARRIATVEQPSSKKLLVLLSLVVNLGLLAYFKYTYFILDNVWAGLSLFGVESTPPALEIILPLGISFYTFQTLSYTIDVYRGFIKPEKDFALYASFVTFFPQLVAGPILRAREVIWQLSTRPAFSLEQFCWGIRRMLYGLFLKVVLADHVAEFVDAGFLLPAQSLSALDTWTLSFLFGYQIYFDFSAYSHIAIGSAALMGLRFPENFNFPYMAVSPKDFWRRWHISLSSWIRDYLYLPLCGATVHDRSVGGLKEAVADTKAASKHTSALFLTWAIMGLWHGAAWTFVVWGLYHAVIIYLYRISSAFRERLPERARLLLGWGVTLGCAMLAWVPFRAASLKDTFVMWSMVFQPSRYFFIGMKESNYLLAAVLLLITTIAYLVQQYLVPRLRRRTIPWMLVETAMLAVTIVLVMVFLRPTTQFIYFQF